MVKTDLPRKGRGMCTKKYMFLILSWLTVFPLFSNTYNEGLLDLTLACNNNVQVSLNGSCEAIISPDIVLEGEESIPGYDPANYTVTIDGVTGSTVTLETPGVYTASINELTTGNSCWGTITVEDKLAPLVECDCPVGGEEFAEFDSEIDNTFPIATVDCADLNSGFAGNTAGYEVFNFAVTSVATFNLNFTMHTVGCNFSAAVYASNFDPEDPCANQIATGNSTSNLMLSMLDPGPYQLVVFVDEADLAAPCDYTVVSSDFINMYEAECMFLCNQEEGILNGTISVPQPDVTEECTNVISNFNDEVSDFGCGSRLITRTWSFEDEFGNTSSCSQEFVLSAISLADVVAPEPILEIPCQNAFEPDDIFNYFRAIGNSVAEANQKAYPTINGIPFTGNVCALAITKQDAIIPICPGESKILRTWLIVDWCTGQVQELVQIIKTVDFQLMDIDVKE